MVKGRQPSQIFVYGDIEIERSICSNRAVSMLYLVHDVYNYAVEVPIYSHLK